MKGVAVDFDSLAGKAAAGFFVTLDGCFTCSSAKHQEQDDASNGTPIAIRHRIARHGMARLSVWQAVSERIGPSWLAAFYTVAARGINSLHAGGNSHVLK
jgi:hypothetical protein